MNRITAHVVYPPRPEPEAEPERIGHLNKYAPNTHPWNMADTALLRKLWGHNSPSKIATLMRRGIRTIRREAARVGLV